MEGRMDAWMREVGILAPPLLSPAAAWFWVTVKVFLPPNWQVSRDGLTMPGACRCGLAELK